MSNEYNFGDKVNEYNFGEKLKMYRKKCKLTQAQLGKALGKSASTIYGYENNRIMPSYDVVCRLSSILDADVAVLLGINEPKEKYDYYSTYQKLISMFGEPDNESL